MIFSDPTPSTDSACAIMAAERATVTVGRQRSRDRTEQLSPSRHGKYDCLTSDRPTFRSFIPLLRATIEVVQLCAYRIAKEKCKFTGVELVNSIDKANARLFKIQSAMRGQVA